MTDYQYLFRPLAVGHKVLKNRIICGPHVTNFWPNHLPDARTTAYYEERAAGGVGMVIIGAAPVDETAKHAPFIQCGLWNDDCVPGLRDITEAVHRHGAVISIQLAQPGVHQTPGGDEWPLVGPSQVPAIEGQGRIPRELEVEDIAVIVQKFADAAERAQRAGFDGVEFHGAHGYLLWSFVTPLMNKRTDQYGGSLDNRLRFYLETIDAVRKRVGKDFIIGCRISSTELAPGGLESEDIAEIAQRLEATGQIDYIHCSIGLYRSIHYTVPSHYSGMEPGYQAEFTGQIKAALKKIPVFVVGRINDPMLADKLIADGAADACVIVRELIAEPEFANKAQAGRIDEIRPCAYWGQGCISRIFASLRVSCQMNAAVGEELEYGSRQLRPAAVPKHLLVIGGGPAGLEFARVAASRGHRVTLHERDSQLGGQSNLFARLPGRAEVRNWIDWMVRQVDRAGVEIRLGSEINSGNLDTVLAASGADEIVVASGARAAADGRSAVTTEPIPGHDRPHVLTYEALLRDGVSAALGERVLIVDELADRIAPGVAEMLAAAGRQVEIVTRWPAVSQEFLTLTLELPFVYEKLETLGVKRTPDSWITAIGEGSVTAINLYAGRTWEIAADSVVLVTTKYSNHEIARLVKQRAKVPVHTIGDAVAPRQVGNAVQEGMRLAFRI